MTTVWIIVAIVWIVGIFIAYTMEFKKKGYDYPVWFSIFWPVMIPLWLIHAIHNKE